MITIKNKKEIAILREGGKILAGVMKKLEENLEEGMSTLEIDKLAETLIKKAGGTPAFKNYGGDGERPFPATVCVSLNNEVVHGIPCQTRIIQSGDLVKLDIGLKYKNLFTDMARTFTVGPVSEDIQKLIFTTEHSFWEGVKKMKAGARLSNYSKAVENYVHANGFSVVQNLVGHGIGKDLHEDPQIPNYYEKKYQDVVLASGMVLALEPMVNAGGLETVLGKDSWVFKTKDGSLSAHYENTVIVTEKGIEIITLFA